MDDIAKSVNFISAGQVCVGEDFAGPVEIFIDIEIAVKLISGIHEPSDIGFDPDIDIVLQT